tara:strand:+ start:2622 stop:3551 length:930 start_codon:yes stop_codon:yes gene_type:complete
MNLKPSTQKNLFEHNDEFTNLVNLHSKNKLPNQILLSGERGIGKCTLAYHFINYVLSLDENYSYDLNNFEINNENKSYKLTQNKTNPNLNLIDVIDDKKNIDINQIRDLISNLNKSSFNLKPRFVLIDNVDLLNINSINALLKIIEEPNDNIIFILINNNKKILPTLNSRCLNFKISLTYVQSINIINKILNKNIFDSVSKELINFYSTPGELYNLIIFSNEIDINLESISLREFISLIISKKYYKKESSIKNLIYSMIEYYFRINTSIDNTKLIKFHNYFLNKINDTKKFNLDEESLFIEFEDIILNG